MGQVKPLLALVNGQVAQAVLTIREPLGWQGITNEAQLRGAKVVVGKADYLRGDMNPIGNQFDAQPGCKLLVDQGIDNPGLARMVKTTHRVVEVCNSLGALLEHGNRGVVGCVGVAQGKDKIILVLGDQLAVVRRFGRDGTNDGSGCQLGPDLRQKRRIKRLDELRFVRAAFGRGNKGPLKVPAD